MSSFEHQMQVRASRREIDDRLSALAPSFLKSFPGIHNSFHSCISSIAVAIEKGFQADAQEAIDLVSEYLQIAEAAWQSEAMQTLRVQSRKDLLTTLQTPRELREESQSLQDIPEALDKINQMRACVHCLDAADAALLEMIPDGRRASHNLYPSSWQQG